jgi:hypothetical protein
VLCVCVCVSCAQVEPEFAPSSNVAPTVDEWTPAPCVSEDWASAYVAEDWAAQ